MVKKVYPVPADFAQQRLDAVLARFAGISRSKAAALIEEGNTRVDGEIITKAAFRFSGEQILEADIPAPATFEPVPTPVPNLGIIYQDEDIVVVDKPAGVAAHASLNFAGPDVLGALLAMGIKLTTSGPPERQGIVHRLDVGTSGCMVVAKSEKAYSYLKRAFKERSVDKTYHALVQGHPDPLFGTIDAPIARDYRQQWKMGVQEGGKHAITHYDTIEAMAGATLLSINLETGRTHQIRVHMAALNHPCVGDTTYGADPVLAEKLNLERQWLHAVKLGFVHPVSGKYVSFQSAYAPELQTVLEQMRAGAL